VIHPITDCAAVTDTPDSQQQQHIHLTCPQFGPALQSVSMNRWGNQMRTGQTRLSTRSISPVGHTYRLRWT